MDDRAEIHGSKGVAYADLLHGNAIETYSATGYDYAVEKAGSTVGWSFRSEWTIVLRSMGPRGSLTRICFTATRSRPTAPPDTITRSRKQAQPSVGPSDRNGRSC